MIIPKAFNAIQRIALQYIIYTNYIRSFRVTHEKGERK